MKRICLLMALSLVLNLLVGAQPAPALDRSTTQRVMLSVVQLIVTNKGRHGHLVPKWAGSGTIISPNGLILTNCHVALPKAMWDDSTWDYDRLVVALTIRSDQPPQPTYLAEVVQYDPDLDLAVVQVSHRLDGSPVDTATLNLPSAPLGDSDSLEIGDALYIFGYPSIGGETITLTTGTVSGFSSEKGVKGRAWIKTDATIAGGNSGGTAVNEQGELVGIPTQGGSGSGDEVVDCRFIADTNGDGVIDEQDTCVPMGGFINALRPVNLAKLLAMAAMQGIGPQPSPQARPEPPTQNPRVSRLFFAPAINEADQPVTVVESLPSGAEDFYLFFDYEGFQDGTAWQPVLAYEGQVERDVWPLSNWDGGPQGTWWLSIHREPLADGRYEISLLYAGQEIGSAAIEVGGPEEGRPTFRNITFSGGGEEGTVLPAGIAEVTASFEYAHMASDIPWTYLWYKDGRGIAKGEGEPLEGEGRQTLVLAPSQGLGTGTYRLELYRAGRLAATADFTLKATGGPFFGPITFAEDVDRKGNPVNPGTVFPNSISALYAFFDYEGMQDGWTWARRWYVDGELAVEGEDEWSGGESGQNFWVSIYVRRGTLPEGEYQLDLLVEGKRMRSGTCTVEGKGARPMPTPVPPGAGVELYGRVTDADTGQGIPNALFLVLEPGLTAADFTWTQDEVYTWAETDRNGDYRLPVPLVRGETYSLLIAAQGYILVAEDGMHIPEDLASPHELNVVLQRAR